MLMPESAFLFASLLTKFGHRSFSNAHAFVLNSGYGCDEAKEELADYIDETMADSTGVCIDDRMYYLAQADGDATECECRKLSEHGPCQTTCIDKKFTAPPGIDALDQCGDQDARERMDIRMVPCAVGSSGISDPAAHGQLQAWLSI